MSENNTPTFENYTPINFQEVPVFWASIFPGQEKSFKGRAKWKVDICLTTELFDELDDHNFNVKEPQRKFLKLIGSPDEKENQKGKNEETRGQHVTASAPTAYEKDDGEIEHMDPPYVVGPDAQPWDPKKLVGNGTICNIECHAKKWPEQGTVTLYLKAVQIIKLVEYEGSDLPPVGSSFKPQGDAPGATFSKK